MKLSDYYPSMQGATQVQPASQMANVQPQIPNDQTQVSAYLRTTVPLPLQYSPDTLKQYNRPGLSSYRTSPIGPNGIPGINSAISSTTTTNINAFATVAAVGPNGAIQFANGGSLDGVSQFEWLNSISTLAITGTINLIGTANATVFNATTGFQVAGAATTGHYLRGNGTNFVSAVLSGSDIATGIVGVTYGGTGSNLSATGGTSEVLLQTTAGGNISVRQLTYADIAGSIPPASFVSASVNLTTQTANVSPSTLFAVGASGAGQYLVTVYLVVSQAATVSSTLPDSELIYTDQDSGATITVPITSGVSTNTTSTFAQAEFMVNAKASTNIQYAIGQVTPYASSGATPMQFAARFRAVYLG